jgi:predicted RNA binding protein with dsRBD fold (UPF0201 family)
MDVRIVARVGPTEDMDKVTAAIRNLFPRASVEPQEPSERTLLVATTTSLDRFKTLLEKQKIRDTARAILHAARQGDHLSFTLHKQAAYSGIVNFATVDHPLGHLEVTVRDDNIEEFITWLTA